MAIEPTFIYNLIQLLTVLIIIITSFIWLHYELINIRKFYDGLLSNAPHDLCEEVNDNGHGQTNKTKRRPTSSRRIMR